MKVRKIVKVMNFHSLLHIDAARRETEKYIRMESEVSKIIDIILNNRNFILDKVALDPNKNLPPLNIYIGSDLSFCGALNSQVNGYMLKDKESEKIIVGKKLKAQNATNIKLTMTKDEFDTQYHLVEEQLRQSIYRLRNSSINVVYNHYYNSGQIGLRSKKIFPTPVSSDAAYSEDFVVEGDVHDLLRSLTSLYADYEVKIASIGSFASENIMRQNATMESLKKIDEIMEERAMLERKMNKQKSFRKIQEIFVTKKFFGGEER